MNGTQRSYRRRSLFGPLLVAAIGVVILLNNLGYFSRQHVFWWFSRYWPLILILWGIVKFAEYLWARSRNEPYPGIGGGGVVFLVFLILFGMAATGATRVNWGFVDIDPGDDWGDGLGIFGTRYDFTESFATPMPTGKQVRVLSSRGDITITPSPDDQAHVFVHKYVRGHSQDEANQFNNATHPKFDQQGSVWLLDLTGGSFSQGRFKLEMQVPPKYMVSLTNRRGDIHVSQIQADVDIETSRGDVMAEQIKGNAQLRAHRGDVKATSITGNVSVDGDVRDTAVVDVGGTVNFTGSYTRDIELSHISGQIKFNSIRTDLQLARLDGDLNMDRSNLRADSVSGPFILRTDAKDIHIEKISGDVHIDDRTGNIRLEASASPGNIDISTTDSEINIHLPENAGFQVDAESDNGQILSDFGSLNIHNERSNATAVGTVGKGGPLVRLKTTRGTIQIHKQ